MPFGLCNAPAVFQEFVNDIFRDLLGKSVVVYLDDILIFSQDLETHRSQVKEALSRLRENFLFAKLEKCTFEVPKISFLGYIISGLKVDPEKVRAIQEMPAPTDVQHFLGMVMYLSKFCGHLPDMCEPLRQLTHKDSLWEWTEIQQTAFDSVKQSIADAATLKYYNPLQAVVIQCDASENGLGAALMQEKEPVAFASRALTTTEHGYAQIEKELCCCFWYGEVPSVHIWKTRNSAFRS
uniref:ribonuclease H n=1 Tax=Xenopus tropicalis TaxID=8364 RepID=A0A803K434_XENTR